MAAIALFAAVMNLLIYRRPGIFVEGLHKDTQVKILEDASLFVGAMSSDAQRSASMDEERELLLESAPAAAEGFGAARAAAPRALRGARGGRRPPPAPRRSAAARRSRGG